MLYWFATLLIAVFVEPSAWPAWVNLTAAGGGGVVFFFFFFFVAAILSYIARGARRDTSTDSRTRIARSRCLWRC